MSLLDINENINDYPVIKHIIRRFLNDIKLDEESISDKCYLIANKTKKEIEYDSNPDQWYLMYERSTNPDRINGKVFIAKLRANWRIGNENIFKINMGSSSNNSDISLDYILTKYEY